LIIYGSDRYSFQEFRRLCRDVTRCVTRDSQTLPAEQAPLEWWVNRVAELALEKRPDSPLVADAYRCRPLSHPGDFRPPTDEDLAALAREPHYIKLPSNVFQCSVWAIDLILQAAGPSPSPPSQPIPPLSAAPGDTPEAATEPEATRGKGKASGPLVVLGRPADEPTVRGKRKPRLTDARYAVIQALLQAGDAGLIGDDLVLKSGRGGAINVLKELARSDPDWGSVIILPGGSGKRYRLRLTDSDGG
jgi:hypothetical protein